MAQKVLILGDSGTGKSASLRNFKPEELLVINAAGKPLPFKNHFECITPSFEKLSQDVLNAMDSTNKKVIVIDDAQYIMSFQYMRRIKENGWDKWNDIQGDFFNIIKACDYMPDDVIVYFLSHLQRDDEGREKIKTMGKMLDEKITIEGLFTTVLKTNVTDGTYCFLTQNSGKDTVKSPIGMFDSYAIDNDLKYVDTKIRNYYEIGDDFVSDEEIAKMDQEAAKAGIKKEDTSGGRRRRKQVSESKQNVEKTGLGTVDGQRTVSEPASSTGQDDGSAEPKKVISGSNETENAENQVEKTTDGSKRRRRKDRNGENKEEKSEEAPAEEAKEEVAANTADQPKRRRRQRKEVDDGFMNIPDIPDEELPFN